MCSETEGEGLVCWKAAISTMLVYRMDIGPRKEQKKNARL